MRPQEELSTRPHESLVAVADIGTSKITVVAATIGPAWAHVCASSAHETPGVDPMTGEAVNRERLAQALMNAIEDTETQAGRKVRGIHLGVSAGAVETHRVNAAVRCTGPTVTDADVRRAIDAARNAAHVAAGDEIVHTIVREFVVDQRDGVSRPVGMAGTRLEVRTQVVSARKVVLDTLRACAARCGVAFRGAYLDSLAASRAVLTDPERERGVTVVDIGAATTDLAVWSDGALVYSASLEGGGNQVTGDVGEALRVPRAAAERMKRLHGSALVARTPHEEMIPVLGAPGRTGQHVSRRIIARVMEDRLTEQLAAVRDTVERSGCSGALVSGYVLTGGGATVPGLQELAERALGAPVRIGIPSGVVGAIDPLRQPKFSAAVGLLLYAVDDARTDTEPPGMMASPGGGSGALRRQFARLIRRIL